jgi:hypothetical protein
MYPNPIFLPRYVTIVRFDMDSFDPCPPTSESSLCIFSLWQLLHPVSASNLPPSCFPCIIFSKLRSPAGSDADADTPIERPIRHVPLCTFSHNVHPLIMNLMPVVPPPLIRWLMLLDLFCHCVSSRCSFFWPPIPSFSLLPDLSDFLPWAPLISPRSIASHPLCLRAFVFAFKIIHSFRIASPTDFFVISEN